MPTHAGLHDGITPPCVPSQHTATILLRKQQHYFSVSSPGSQHQGGLMVLVQRWAGQLVTVVEEDGADIAFAE